MSQDRENSLKTYSYLLNLVGELTYIYLKNTDMYAIIILEDFWNGSDCLPYTGWWWFRLPPITGWWWFRLPPLHRLVVVPIASPTPVGGGSDCLPFTGWWWFQLPPLHRLVVVPIAPHHRLVVVSVASPTPVGGGLSCFTFYPHWTGLHVNRWSIFVASFDLHFWFIGHQTICVYFGLLEG